jgi:serine protease Do
MNHSNIPVDPWDQGTYQTGSTQPPKSRGGIIAVLLVLVIFLCGVVTFMTVMNIRLVGLLNSQSPNPTSPVSFMMPETTASTDSTAPMSVMQPKDDETLQLHTTPTGIPNQPNDEAMSLQDIYENTIDSVVSISCSSLHSTSTGTGLILTEDGYIVTNAHVIEGAAVVQVILQSKQSYQATVVGADEITDLAVLRIDAMDLHPAKLGDSDNMRVGDTVVAIGDPLGLELSGSMTDGIVSAINRDISVDGRSMTLIQTNAALNSGNSGGPLINCYGQVVGINTMKIGDYMSSAGVEGLGFAIPSDTVSDIVTQLIRQGYVSGRPTLGITGEAVTTFYQLYYGLPNGLYISQLERGCDAEKQGLRAGDILLTVDENRIVTQTDLDNVVYTHEVGDVIPVTVYRDGKQGTFYLTVEEDKN